MLVKGVFFPLANRSYRSMSAMKKVQPEMTRLRELYKDDKVKQQQALMELYKKEKINPLAGCWPIAIQIPVFFSLYKVLFVTIEMRHAPFFGWIHDLSAPDPTHVFNLFGLLPYDPSADPLIGSFLAIGLWPLIMGITMFVQMKLNPTPPDPAQAMIFTWMPVLFTFMLASFPAGLVIYWAWNNTLSVTQQYVIMRRYGTEVNLWQNIVGTFRRTPKAATAGASGQGGRAAPGQRRQARRQPKKRRRRRPRRPRARTGMAAARRPTSALPAPFSSPSIHERRHRTTMPLQAAAIEAGRRLFARPGGIVMGVASVAGLPPAAGSRSPSPDAPMSASRRCINALVGQKALARTSNTPGRTRELNLFGADDSGPDARRHAGLRLRARAEDRGRGVDDGSSSTILRGRPNLRRVYLLVDARHGLKENDTEALTLLDKAAVSYQVVLTKADKLKPTQNSTRRSPPRPTRSPSGRRRTPM